MIADIFRQFNWVDLFLIGVCARVCYISLKRGFVVEVFKVFGTLAALYVGLHYYTGVSDFLKSKLMLKVLPLEFRDFLCFILLAGAAYAVFLILRESFGKLIRTEAVQELNRWGGLAAGIIRAILLCGLLAYSFAIASVSYLRTSLAHSYFGKRMFAVAPAVYRGMWNGIFSRFVAGEGFNATVTEVQETFLP